jgi:hypothetical protein
MQTALKREAPAAPQKPATIETAKPAQDLQINVVLQKMAAAGATSPLSIMREYCSLAFGPGQVTFKDYTRLRLFDRDFYPDKRTVVGQRKNRDLDLTINFRHDWIGLFANKIASASYLAAHGFPTIPLIGIYTERLASPSHLVIANADELKAFLRRPDHYPLFGKPIEGVQSLGSIGFARYDSGADRLETIGGETIPVDDFASDVLNNYSHGYLFQKFLSPHPAIRDMCGNRLATARIVTLARDGEPSVFRACWKIPSGPNMADNYWRPGNLLAQIDVTTGKVLRAMSGTGLDLAYHNEHPDTKAPLVGMAIPRWDDLKQTAIEAARLLRHMPLIGFDMAMSETGPVVVEMNHNPDFFLNQLADGRGVLDAEFGMFVAEQKRKAAERTKMIKREVRQL